ncbi:MAG: hypothetical protein SGI83_03970 [Bacteroidota bacterium]|nr:hypothetical protein [Bacteroidota bacterium]
MKFSIFFFLSFLATSSLYSQNTDSLKYKYTNQTIYRYGSSFMKGTERLNFGQLRNEFAMSEMGLAAYDNARKYKTTSIVFRLASIAAGIATIAIISKDGNRSTAYVLLGSQFVLGLGGGRFSMLSAQSLDKALWQRNKDLLFPAR